MANQKNKLNKAKKQTNSTKIQNDIKKSKKQIFSLNSVINLGIILPMSYLIS